jgi:quercetin dioxygenase-like cupin family protein
MSADMSNRIARFNELEPITIQQDPDISQDAIDLVYARQLLSVVGRGDGASTAVTSSAPIRGAAGITMTIAVCPPGQGPGLHSHKATFETFTVLKGAFEFRFNGASEPVRLACFDTISVPPGVYRAFRNVSQDEGLLQVIISGGENDPNDVEIAAAESAEIRQTSPRLFERLQNSGVTMYG